MQYSEMFKDAMVRKMSGPEALSATALPRMVHVSQTTLSKWLRQAGVEAAYGFPNNAKEYAKMTKSNGHRRPQDFSAEEKLKIVMEAAGLEEQALGAFLRQKGLHKAHLDKWREQMLGGLETEAGRKRARRDTVSAKRIRQLEKELHRKEKALAEAAALLVLKKKVLQIWGDEDDTTAGGSGK